MSVNVQWVQTTAITSATAYEIPAAAIGLPAEAYLTGVQGAIIAPLGNGTAASTASPIAETGQVATASAASQISLDVSTQKLTSGDTIPADSVVTVVVEIAGND